VLFIIIFGTFSFPMRSAVRAGYIDRSTAATGVGRSAANASSVMTILNAINSILFYTFLSLSAEHRLVPFWFSECPSLLCTFRVCRVASCEFAAAAVCVDCAGYCVSDLGDLQFDQFIDFRHPHYVTTLSLLYLHHTQSYRLKEQMSR